MNDQNKQSLIQDETLRESLVADVCALSDEQVEDEARREGVELKHVQSRIRMAFAAARERSQTQDKLTTAAPAVGTAPSKVVTIDAARARAIFQRIVARRTLVEPLLSVAQLHPQSDEEFVKIVKDLNTLGLVSGEDLDSEG